MSKKTKKSTSAKNVPPQNKKPVNWLATINPRKATIVAFLIVLLILIIFYKPYVIDRLEPAGGDRMASIAQSKFINDYREQTGEIPLWNPAIFCGVPIYYALWSNSFNLDYLISKISKVIDWKLSWFILATVGMFLIFWLLEFPWYYALLGTIAFLFYPHYQALITVGHFAKVRAVCAMPLAVFGFLYLVKKRNFLSFLLFVIFFSLQLRTQHYQIVFYTLLVFMALGIRQIVEWVKTKQAQKIYISLGLFVAGLVTSVLMSAQPLFVTNEYTPYSTRGGQAINLKEDAAQAEVKSSGVTFEYATRWSLNPKELATLIVPRFYGGTSQEPYTGKAYPQLRGQPIPGYWGDMPFTQSCEYMGILIVILALLGLWYYRKDGVVISLFILLVFSLLLGFGSHFPILYKPLFKYLPYFSKFRVPSMILILVDFILVILSVYGLKGLVEKFDLAKYKSALMVSGFFILFGLFFLLAPGVLSYTSAQDAQYMNNPQVIEMLRTARREFLQADTLRMLVFVICFGALVVLYKMKKIRPDFLIGAIIILVAVDLINVSKRFLRADELVDTKSLERRYFAETSFDKILKQDQEIFRILGLGNHLQSNDLAYRYQIVTGYSPIKPQLIQDLIDNNLVAGPTQSSLNWNVINMLNAKYIIAPGMLNEPNLTILDVNQQRKEVLYLNEGVLPRAYFVSEVRFLPSEKDVVAFMNTTEFDPAKMALTSVALDTSAGFDTGGSVQVTDYTPNRVVLNVETERPAFLVLADAYYPKGWTARVNGVETPIYQVNHVLRGVSVPAGSYAVEFKFLPRSYQIASQISTISCDIVWLSLLGVLIYQNREKIKNLKKKRPTPAKSNR
ncbi:MAG TPA: YfhO family protein [Candidatus Marinimicrobia bacterium]|nr:YfhO family protein [Candidatus Neomarinimicrobiota bacterium]